MVALTYGSIEDEWPVDYPLESQGFRDFWPGGARTPPYSETLAKLEFELAEIRASTAVLRIAARPGDFRRDGGLRADARPEHPGVMLQLSTPHGPLSFVTDKYRHWQDNVRAIALALEGLRRLDRYGITRGGNQYRGWKALPPGTGQDGGPAPFEEPVKMSVDEAIKVICETAGAPNLIELWATLPKEVHSSMIRTAVKRTHPDAGGDELAYAAVAEARGILEAE